MADRELLLQEFAKAYERLLAARVAAKERDDENALRHAEQNFHAVAESLARLLHHMDKRAND